jgi:hypothetical protein
MTDYLGRTGGPFLDHEELVIAEKRNAAAEDREPDFSVDHLREMAGLAPLEPVSGAPDPGSETAVEENAKGLKLSEAPKKTAKEVEDEYDKGRKK